MAPVFRLEVVTPYRKFFEDDVEMVIIKTTDGEMGVLHGHVPMVAVVDIGPIRILQNGKWVEAAVSEGFMEIMPDKTVILTDSAEWPEEIDIERAKRAMERAEERLKSKDSYMEHVKSRAAISRAMVRLKVTRKAD